MTSLAENEIVKNRLSWMIGGAQGSGVDSSANMFSRACNFGGLFVYGSREYYSNIMGEHSYFNVRVSDRQARSPADYVNLLATFDAETVVRHALDVTSDGGIVYDPAQVAGKIVDIPTLERSVITKLVKLLKEGGLNDSIWSVLQAAQRRGVHLYSVPYDEFLKEVGGEFGEAKLSRIARIVNTMAVAASFSLLDFDLRFVNQAIKATFSGKPRVAEINMVAAKKAYEHVKSKYGGSFCYRLESVANNDKRIYIQGSQVVALGKLVSGCRLQTYYPITPASDESEYLEAHEVFDLNTTNPQIEEAAAMKNSGSILVVQTEDEIAAITMAIGGALSGARSSTSTSGPGFSLMVEGLGWAGMNEVPVVVTYYQRGGPSTGLPTRHEQGDLRFALHAGHGEFPRIVLASGDLRECFYDATLAFNYAEKYQLPVIHLIDKALANSAWTDGIYNTGIAKIDRGMLLTEADLEKQGGPEGYKRFKYTESGVSPRAVLGMKGAVFWNTGDEHDEYGHISEDPEIRVKMMEKRMRKLELAAREIPDSEKLNFFEQDGADATIVSWGSTKGALLDAIELLSNDGFKVNFLQIRLIKPFPTEFVKKVLDASKMKIGVEMNYSAQLMGIVREHTGIAMDSLIVKYNGRPMSYGEVYRSVKDALVGEAPRRVVLTYGA